MQKGIGKKRNINKVNVYNSSTLTILIVSVFISALSYFTKMCNITADFFVKSTNVLVLATTTDSSLLISLPSISSFVTFLAYTANELINIKEGKGYLSKQVFTIALVGVVFNGVQIVGVNLQWVTFLIWEPIYYLILSLLFFLLMFMYLKRLFIIIQSKFTN